MYYKAITLLLVYASFFSTIYGEDEELDPAFAGTLLSFYSKNVPPGDFLIEPIFFLSSTYGSYNKNWSWKNKKDLYDLELFFVLETGITKFVDIALVLDGLYSWIGSQKTLELSDTQVYLGFQISEDKKGTKIPDFRLLLGESFPTGKYDNLDEAKFLSDGVGSGAYETILGAVLQKAFYFQTKHLLFINLTGLWFIPTNTNVSEFNVYGGGLNTDGTVSPGQQVILNLGLEYKLNNNWEIALDLRYNHYNSSKFNGEAGCDIKGIPNSVGLPSSEQFSLAPSVEYHHNEHFTASAGIWGTVFGRNSNAFASFVLRLAYYY